MHRTLKAVYWVGTHQFMLLAIAGAAGTLARYWLSGIIHRVCGANFPWGTLAVNVAGCLMFGIFWTLAEERMLISGQTRLVVLTGFMGAFTTFSTFAFETAQLFDDGEWLRALGSMALQNFAGLGAVFLGFAIGRFV